MIIRKIILKIKQYFLKEKKPKLVKIYSKYYKKFFNDKEFSVENNVDLIYGIRNKFKDLIKNENDYLNIKNKIENILNRNKIDIIFETFPIIITLVLTYAVTLIQSNISLIYTIGTGKNTTLALQYGEANKIQKEKIIKLIDNDVQDIMANTTNLFNNILYKFVFYLLILSVIYVLYKYLKGRHDTIKDGFYRLCLNILGELKINEVKKITIAIKRK